MQSYEVDEQITKLQLELEECIHQNKEYDPIIKKLDELREIRDNLKEKDSEEKDVQNRLVYIKQFIEMQSTLLQTYDEDIVRRLLNKVIVSDSEVEIVFKTGQLLKLKRYQK